MTSSAEINDAKEQEIFEFPWVVFDVQSKQVVDEKRLYVKPTLHESLGIQCAESALDDDAASCMESAGTLQQAVQVSVQPVASSAKVAGASSARAPLNFAIRAQEFNDYVYRSFIANNKDFCILTVSELPIKRWLWGEEPIWFWGVSSGGVSCCAGWFGWAFSVGCWVSSCDGCGALCWGTRSRRQRAWGGHGCGWEQGWEEAVRGKSERGVWVG